MRTRGLPRTLIGPGRVAVPGSADQTPAAPAAVVPDPVGSAVGNAAPDQIRAAVDLTELYRTP